MNEAVETRYQICPLCEATCGLEIETQGRTVRSIRGDELDVFSRGYFCPKGVALKELDADPDRLREPRVRRDGKLVPASWDEAFEEIDRKLAPILEEYGADALATYLGNPVAHNMSLLLYANALMRAFPTRSRFSASTVDQAPKQLASGLMFGTFLTIAVPDIDRCDYLLMLGANPLASNGSLFTVPDFRGRVRAMQSRGGRLVVIDPRRTETAKIADEHLFIRPGTDAHFLIGVVSTLFAERLTRVQALDSHLDGLAEVERAVSGFEPERVAPVCGIPAERIRSIARELAEAERAAVYGRIGTCTQAYGTLASWLIDVLNILTGNLDRPGGAMFPLPVAFSPNTEGVHGIGDGVRVGRWQSRVRGAPELMGELPVACLAEEIETPGKGQIRALITFAGNPAISTPNGGRLSRALASLEFMVSLDIYLNETTRHADVILPGLSPLERSHYDVVFPQFSVRNWARYSAPVFEGLDRPAEWELILRLIGVLLGQGPKADVGALDDLAIRLRVKAAVADAYSVVCDREVDEILKALEPQRGPERLVDFAIRTGPFGDAVGGKSLGITLAKIKAQPHGIELGPLLPRLPEVLRTPSGKVQLAPEYILGDLPRLHASLDEKPRTTMLLIGRRQLRSNNSWMHNLPTLAKGRVRCTVLIHPGDAKRLGIDDGALTRVTSRTDSVELPAEISDTIMPGVVSIPHGWGHDQQGTNLRVAQERPGVNSNRLADEQEIEPLSGNAILSGIPVSVEPVGSAG